MAAPLGTSAKAQMHAEDSDAAEKCNDRKLRSFLLMRNNVLGTLI